MSELTDLKASIDALRQTLTTNREPSGGAAAGVAAGITAAAVASIVDTSIVNRATAVLASAIDGVSVTINEVGRNFAEAIRAFSDEFAREVGVFEGLGMEVTQFYQVMQSVNRAFTGLTADMTNRAHLTATQADNAYHSRIEAADTHAAPKKKDWGLGNFQTWINRSTLALAGMVTVGLKNTTEGYKLSLAFERLAYALADAVLPFVNLLTRVFNQLSAEMHFINGLPGKKILEDPTATTGQRIGAAVLDPRGLRDSYLQTIEQQMANETNRDRLNSLRFGTAERGIREKDQAKEDLGMRQMHRGWADAENIHKYQQKQKWTVGGDYDEEADKRAQADKKFYESGIKHLELLKEQTKNEPGQKVPGKQNFDATKPKQINEEKDHLHPLYQTQFMTLTSLWEQMNKYATENPGLDVVSSWLEKIFNKMPEPDKGAGPKPAAAGAIGA